MASLNKVMIIGRLGRDPEISYTPGGLAITKLNLATSEVRNDKNTGERQERTEWHRVTMFGKMAETAGRYLAKGREVYVEGRLETSQYEKDGITRYSTSIIANNFQFIGSKSDNAGQQAGDFQGGGHQGGHQAGGGYNQPPAQQQQAPQSYGSGGGYPGSYNQPPPQPQQPPAHPQGGFDQGNTGGGYGGEQPGFTNPPDDDIPF